jgi:hypothetical protein
MTQSLATVAARIAAKTWGGRWTADERHLETREPGSFPGSKGSREERHAERISRR